MSLSAEREFTYLEIWRPVDQVQPFLNKVRYYGDQILGNDGSTVITQPGEGESSDYDEVGPPILTITETGTPRIQVYNPADVRLDLLYRRVPSYINYGARFNYAATRLDTEPRRVHRPILREGQHEPVYRASILREGLKRIALTHEMNDEAIGVVCDSLQAVHDPYLNDKGVELALGLSPEDEAVPMLLDQAAFCYRALLTLSRKAATPDDGGRPFSIPFARLAWDVEHDERKRMAAQIKELLPIRVVLSAAKSVAIRAGSP